MLVIMINKVNNEQVKKMNLEIIPLKGDVIVINHERYVVENRVLDVDGCMPEICLDKGIWYIFCVKTMLRL